MSPYGGFGSTAALVFVLLVAGVKAVYEDFKRHNEDKETNNSVTHVMQPDGGLSRISWLHGALILWFSFMPAFDVLSASCRPKRRLLCSRGGSLTPKMRVRLESQLRSSAICRQLRGHDLAQGGGGPDCAGG